MKTVFMAVVCVLVVGVASASAQGAGMAIKAGINWSSINYDNDPVLVSVERDRGWLVGFLATAPINDRWSTQTEVQLTQKPVKLKSGGAETTFKLNFMESNFMANVRLAGERIPLSFVFGPSLGFRLKAKTSLAGQEQDVTTQTKRLDIGMVTGLSINPGALVLDGRMTWGLKNMDATGTTPFKTRTATLSAGFRW